MQDTVMGGMLIPSQTGRTSIRQPLHETRQERSFPLPDALAIELIASGKYRIPSYLLCRRCWFRDNGNNRFRVRPASFLHGDMLNEIEAYSVKLIHIPINHVLVGGA